MKEIIVIGTLHAGMTPHAELQAEIEKYKPEMLLVEMQQTDIDQNRVTNYPDEMQYILSRARTQQIPIFGFDSPIDILATGKNEEDNQAVIQAQKELFQGYSRQDANKKDIGKLLDTPGAKALIDIEKSQQRDQEMLLHIQELTQEDKQTVIITGVSHLDFLQKHIPEALFPLRY